jgi:hypothetical protein
MTASLTKSILKIVEHCNGATVEEITKILHRNKDTSHLEGIDINRDAIMSRVKAMFAAQTVELVEWRQENRPGCRALVLPKASVVHYTEEPEPQEIVSTEEFSTPIEFDLVAANTEIIGLKNDISHYQEKLSELKETEKELRTALMEVSYQARPTTMSVEISDLVSSYLVRHGVALDIFDDAEQANAVYSRVLEQSTTNPVDKPELFAMIPVTLKVSHLVSSVKLLPKVIGAPHDEE